MNETADVIAAVRRALGRLEPLRTSPTPPEIDEPIARLVSTNIGLGELFVKRAADQKMHASFASVDDVMLRVADFLRQAKCRSVVLPDVRLLRKLDAVNSLKAGGFTARWWSE